MTSKDLSIFNSLKPFSIGFDDMFDQFENMLGNGALTMQSNYPPYNIRKTGKDNYAIEVALAGFNKKDVEIEFEDNLLTVRTKQVNKSDNNLLLLKTEMNAGHGGKSGRDGAIEEIAIDYAFTLKISKKI